MSAGLAVRQLQLAVASNVRYLDGGWQTLVDGLRACAESHGVRLRVSAAVTAVERAADGRVTGVRLRDERVVPARAVVLALDARRGRRAASRWPGPALRGLGHARAGRLPGRRARAPAAAARDASRSASTSPRYCSVHSAVARLAPDGRRDDPRRALPGRRHARAEGRSSASSSACSTASSRAGARS